jgi:hypothetical protein
MPEELLRAPCEGATIGAFGARSCALGSTGGGVSLEEPPQPAKSNAAAANSKRVVRRTDELIFSTRSGTNRRATIAADFSACRGARSLLSPALGLKSRMPTHGPVRQVVAPARRENFDGNGVRDLSLRHADRNPMKRSLYDVA